MNAAIASLGPINPTDNRDDRVERDLTQATDPKARFIGHPILLAQSTHGFTGCLLAIILEVSFMGWGLHGDTIEGLVNLGYGCTDAICVAVDFNVVEDYWEDERLR